MKKIIPFLLVVLLISSCLPQNVQVPQSPLLSTLERKSGLIAYIGIDGNMYVSDQGGGKLSQLTKDASATNQSGEFNFYQLPTWSLDGNQLAFVGTSHGEADYEAFEALDRPLLHEQLAAFLGGHPVAAARFDFATKRSEPRAGTPRALPPGHLLLVEGLHGLHPALFGGILPERALFRGFVNPSTSLAFDALSRVNPSDVRLLRRIVRDRRSRSITAVDNLSRWASVRRGEKRHVFPHLAQADAVFDSALVYEPCVLKVFAE